MHNWLSRMKTLTNIDRLARNRGTAFVDRFVASRLEDAQDTVKSLLEDDFIPQTHEVMASFLRDFFRFGGATYVGVDSHVPTEYMAAYDWFLSIHESWIKEQNDIKRKDVRVIVAGRNELTNDYFKDPSEYLEFFAHR